jgi:hypothetical protein
VGFSEGVKIAVILVTTVVGLILLGLYFLIEGE